jgi:hypothetical protein
MPLMFMARCSTDERVHSGRMTVLLVNIYAKKSALALDVSSSEALMGGTINSDPGLTDNPDTAPAERHQNRHTRKGIRRNPRIKALRQTVMSQCASSAPGAVE